MEKIDNKKEQIVIENDDKKKLKKNIIYLLIKIGFVLLIIYLLFFQIFGLQVVNNEGMKPSLKEGSLVLYYRFDKKYMRGDVVSASINNKNNIYRVLGVEGDTIDITNDGIVLINGVMENNELTYSTLVDSNSDIKYPYKLNKDEIFLINDYRLAINDSRTYGAINKKDINGKVIAKLQIRDF